MTALHPVQIYDLVTALKAGKRWANACKAARITKEQEPEALRQAKAKGAL